MLPLFYVISHYSNLPFRAWEQRELGELMNVKSVKRIHQSDWTDKGIRFLRARDIVSASKGKAPSEYLYISRKIYEEYSKISGKVENGDLLVTGVGSIGIPMLINHDEPLYFKDGNIIWFQNMKYINGEFFYYSFISYSIQKFIRDSAGTGTVGTYTIDSGRKTPIYLSNNNEQEKIGSFFKLLDNTIALHQRKLDALKLMKKAFSQQIFPENNRKKPKIRFTSFYEEWEQRKIGEYGYFYYGKSAPKWSVAQDATTPCVRYGELYTKFGPEIDIVHSYTNIDKSNLKFSSGNEVLVPRVGENSLDFANCSWLSISNVAIGEMISVYNTEQYPLFIAYYFRSKMKYEFAKRVEGGNVSNLYYSYLEDILISVPSIEEQKKIAEFLNKIDITINLLQNKLGRIKELKKAYLQNMFI
ncbi:restriction endonuclease subunit S [Listeria monocytogenes]|uniref:restriction endonuclease subunit S n=1 Tax=Listeria monocytogenes TaxID=1639 RepID=UPI002934BCCF|nr:restriction endonuclease subunit S [Listeria monocytogenes]